MQSRNQSNLSAIALYAFVQNMASNIPLSKEDQEEEEMRNKLQGSGFYYDEITKEEMRMTINLLEGSNHQNSMQNVDKTCTLPSFSQSSNCSEPIKNSSDALENRMLPSFSYKNAVDSGNLITQSSTSKEQSKSEEKNSKLALSKLYGNNLNNEDESSNSESIYEKNSNLRSDEFPTLRSKSNLKNKTTNASKSSTSENKTPTPATIRKANLERWRLNPLLSIEDKYIPLLQTQCSDIQENDSNINDDLDSDTFDKLCEEMSAKLETLQRKCFKSDLSSCKTEWGSPIKVATNWNGSLDKDPFVEVTESFCDNENPDMQIRNTYERATKRKALCNIAAASNDDVNSDDNSDNEFVNTKKRKFQQGKKAEGVTKNNQERLKNKINISPVEMIEVDDAKDFSDSDLFDNSNLHNLNKNLKMKSSVNAESVAEQSIYPRRVQPPNPGKKSFKGPRAKKTNATQSHSSINKNLNEEEINKTLHELTREIDDNDSIDIICEMESDSVLKNIPNKIQRAQSLLENAAKTNEQKIKAEEEARKQKEKEEMLKKQELIQKRLQEEENERKCKMEKERKSKEKEEIYKNCMKMQSKKITKHNYNVINTNYEEVDENLLLNGDDDDFILPNTNKEKQTCPICLKCFPTEDIETHASECNEFPKIVEIDYDQPSSSYFSKENYECVICDEYKTNDVNKYEEHVIKCKQKAEDYRFST